MPLAVDAEEVVARALPHLRPRRPGRGAVELIARFVAGAGGDTGDGGVGRGGEAGIDRPGQGRDRFRSGFGPRIGPGVGAAAGPPGQQGQHGHHPGRPGQHPSVRVFRHRLGVHEDALQLDLEPVVAHPHDGTRPRTPRSRLSPCDDTIAAALRCYSRVTGQRADQGRSAHPV